jgi:hypothetical protein
MIFFIRMIFPCAKIGHFFNRDCQFLSHRKSVPIINVEALISNRYPSLEHFFAVHQNVMSQLSHAHKVCHDSADVRVGRFYE